MSKTKKLKLTKIAIETKDGKQVELTLEEAKELHDQLHTLFGKKATYIPSTPIVIERDRWHPPYRPFWYDVTCDSTDASKPPRASFDTQCMIQSDSGLSVSYCGDAV